MAKASILVVDDEEDIRELVGYNLAKEGYEIVEASSGEDALVKVAVSKPDLIILDLMLPGIDGLDVCRKLKNQSETAEIPILMLSAKGEEADVVCGLEVGADDYVTKPFSPRILLARVKTALRRKTVQPSSDDDVLEIYNLKINPKRHQVEVGNEKVDLTATEFRVLHFLARHPGWVFTRFQIVDAVKGENYAVTERSVDVQIVGLRKKLKDAGELVETVRGVGYRFKDSE